MGETCYKSYKYGYMTLPVTLVTARRPEHDINFWGRFASDVIFRVCFHSHSVPRSDRFT